MDRGELGAVVKLDVVEDDVVEQIARHLTDRRVLQHKLIETFLPAELAKVLAQALEVDLHATCLRVGKLFLGSVSVQHVLHSQVLFRLLAAHESRELGLHPLPVVVTILTPTRTQQLLRWTLANIRDGQMHQARQTEQRVLQRLLLQLGVE